MKYSLLTQRARTNLQLLNKLRTMKASEWGVLWGSDSRSRSILTDFCGGAVVDRHDQLSYTSGSKLNNLHD